MANWKRRLTPRSLWRRLKVGVISLVRRPSELCSPQDRVLIERDIHENARRTTFYYLLLFCACAIATLGLLQSSVAVVIGAMLISPLMGPIMSMGMALARLELREFRQAALSLALGSALAVVAAILIVWVSPLKDVTSEILARTRPTLLDLVVAVLSGVVGAFVTISRKGGVIAGVAIATALMPPLAVLGFGLATASLTIAGGSLLLFLTNVVAIMLGVFIVARRYGFRPPRQPDSRWEGMIILGLMAVLCTPLALSLNEIVTEARLTNQVRADLDTAFAKQTSRVTDLRVEVRGGEVRRVSAVVITKQYVPNAQAVLRKNYPEADDLTVEQVLAANDASLLSALRPIAAAVPVDGTTRVVADPGLTQMLAQTATITDYKRDGDQVDMVVKLKSGGVLADYYSLERAVARLRPDLTVRIRPPRLDVAPLQFLDGGVQTSDAVATDVVLWASERWGLEGAQVVVQEGAGGSALARRRGEAVATLLREGGLSQVTVAVSQPPEGANGPPLAYVYLRPVEIMAAP